MSNLIVFAQIMLAVTAFSYLLASINPIWRRYKRDQFFKKHINENPWRRYK